MSNIQPIRREANERNIVDGTSVMESIEMNLTIDFTLSAMPDLDEAVQEAIQKCAENIKDDSSVAHRKVTITLDIDPINFKIKKKVAISLPKAEVWELPTSQGIRENGTIRLELPKQANLPLE